MPRLFSHLLLSLTLVLNGLLAPWAMAGMSHGAGSVHGAHHQHHGSAEDDTTPVGSHHQHGDQNGVAKHCGDQPADQSEGGRSCCSGTACQCGCVLPPVLPQVLVWVTTQSVTVSPASRVEPFSGIGRARPPLRPPAA